MQTRLTLRLDEAVVRRARALAERRGQTVSQLVAESIIALEAGDAPPDAHGLPPVTRSLYGRLAGAAVVEEDYRRHQEEKHR